MEDYVPDDLGDIAPELSYPFSTPLPPTPPSGSFSLSSRAVRDAVTPVDDSFAHPFGQDDDITHVHSLVSSLMPLNGGDGQQPSAPPQVASSPIPPPDLSDHVIENKDTVNDVYSLVSSATSKPDTFPEPPAKLHSMAPSDFSSSSTQMQAIPDLVSSIFPSDDAEKNKAAAIEPEEPSSSFQIEDVPSLTSSLLPSVLADMDSNLTPVESNHQSSSPPLEDASLLVSASAMFSDANSPNLNVSEITPRGNETSPVCIIDSPVVSRETTGGNTSEASNIDSGFPQQDINLSISNDNSHATVVGDTFFSEDSAKEANHEYPIEGVDYTNGEPSIGVEISSRALQMPHDGAISNPVEKSTILSNPSALPSGLSASKEEEEDTNLVASVLANFNSALPADDPTRFSAQGTTKPVQNKSVKFDFSDFMKAELEVPKPNIDSSPLPPLKWVSPPSKEGDLTENSVVSSLDSLPGIGKRSISGPIDDANSARKLYERLHFFTEVAERHIKSGFNIASIGVAAWTLFAAFVALISGHFGLAAGQSIASGASIYFLQKRKEGVIEVLDDAQSTILDRTLGKNELCEKASDLFSASLEQAFDTATTFFASIFTPISLAIPAVFVSLFGVSGFWSTTLIHLGFGVLGLPFLAASLIMYGKARELAVGKAEVILKPRIDAAILGETTEKTPLIVSSV